MRESFAQLVDGISGNGELTRDAIFWGLLLVGLVFATVHLITMLVTKWGDRKATTKSLIFSILVHVSCALGLIAINAPETIVIKKDPLPKKKPEFTIEDELVTSMEKVEEDESGNTPIWKKLSKPVEVKMQRQEELPRIPETVENPKREPDKITPPELTQPKISSTPEKPIVTPTPQHIGRKAPEKIAILPKQVEKIEAEKRPEISNPTPIVHRSPINRMNQQNEKVDRESAKGDIDRLEKSIDPNRKLLTDNSVLDPSAFLKRSQAGHRVQLRGGPAPSNLPSVSSGSVAKKSGEGSKGRSFGSPRISRILTHPQDGIQGGGVTRLRPDRIPSSPNSTANRPVAVRPGPKTSSSREGLVPNVVRSHPRSTSPRRNLLPSTYRLRSLVNRRKTARKFGGTDASEEAVERGLLWLATHQHQNGYWDADAYGAGKVGIDENGTDRRFAGKHGDVGVTALAVLAFLAAAHTHEEGKYSPNVRKAMGWLIDQQKDDGFLGGNATHYAKMYCHGMATYALAEAYSMQNDPTINAGLREAVKSGVRYILSEQNSTDGGWRYLKGQHSDMSMFGWQLMALKSAEHSGIKIPEAAKKLMIKFLNEMSQGEQNGLTGYQMGFAVTPVMTAEALFCKQMFRIKRDHPASVEATDYLLKNLPKRSQYNLYYWYYGTMSMYQKGGDAWKKWNARVRDQLVAMQRKEGDELGSWDPSGPWGAYGGRVYSTALGTLCLEVYYRYLPLYRMGSQEGEKN